MDDVVGGILFLLSDEARYVTVTTLTIDGGVTKSIFNHMPGRGRRSTPGNAIDATCARKSFDGYCNLTTNAL